MLAGSRPRVLQIGCRSFARSFTGALTTASRYGRSRYPVLPADLAAVPWPALLVSANGAILAASPSAVALLGARPSDIAAFEDRFELLSTSGQPVAPDQHPLRRATRGELFEVGGIWRVSRAATIQRGPMS